MLQTPTQQRATPASHGIRNFGYRVEFAKDIDPLSFGNPWGPWEERVAVLISFEEGYGAQQYCARFKMFDSKSTQAPHIVANRDKLMATPRNGDMVQIWLYDDEHPTGILKFKGAIRSVHNSRGESGVEYVCEAISDVTRLNELHVTFVANLKNNPINPVPKFDPDLGYLVHARQFTVAELIEQVLAFPDAFGRPQFWRYEDIDWSDLETDPRCGGFVPTNVTFNNTKKGDAIEQLLQMAGNYTFVYVPRSDGWDYIKVVEINLACNRCGDPYDITFVNTDTTVADYLTPMASQFTVKQDETEWTSKQTANVCRVIGGPIKFFSGFYMIPEILNNWTGDAQADTRHIFPIYNDTGEKQRARAVSPDGANYRFTFKFKTTEDKRKRKQYPVGLPLFPDWNVHEDYLPQLIEFHNVHLPTPAPVDKNGHTMTAADYTHLVEWGPMTIGDLLTRPGPGRLNHLDNLRTYQAWMTRESCPACNGTGNVKKVYNNDANEPQVAFYAVKPDGTERLLENAMAAGFTLNDGERIIPRVTNYLFDPKKFGEVQPGTTTLWPSTGLTPFDPTDASDPVVQATGGYPLPWKNLCPYCRGVGMKPEYKIRNISPELYSGRNNKAVSPGGDKFEISIDPDATAGDPETWEQSNNRVVLSSGPFLQVEQALDFIYLPTYAHRNEAFDVIGGLSPELRTKRFPHPLQFTTITSMLAGRFNVSSDQSKLVPSDWSSLVSHTTVMMAHPPHQIDHKMGRVLFQSPVFIPCRKQFKTIAMFNDRKTGPQMVITSDGLVSYRPTHADTSDSAARPTGYWRPARVWMTFCYEKDLWYKQLLTDPDGNEIPSTLVDATTPDGDVATYECRGMVIDGRLALEVQKVTVETTPEGDVLTYGTGNRTLQTCIEDASAYIQTAETDLYKMVVPPSIDLTSEEYVQAKIDAGLDFPQGRLLKFERTTPGEEIYEMAGYGSSDYFNSTSRPKPYVWTLKDDRMKLLALGIRTLESTNDILVSGSLSLVSKSVHDTSLGLGFVDYPDRGKAAVKRVTYRFDSGFVTVLELAREKARFGQLPPNEKELVQQVIKDVTDLKRQSVLLAQINANGLNTNTLPGRDDNGRGGGDVGGIGSNRFFVR